MRSQVHASRVTRLLIGSLVLSSAASSARAEVTLTDGSGLKYIINTEITFESSSSASGAASEASYVGPVTATTLSGGSTTSTLNDMFDGVGAIAVSFAGPAPTTQAVTGNPAFHIYNQAGASTLDTSCSDRQILYPDKTLTDGENSVVVSRRVFVPADDTFIRWLNVFTNPGPTPLTFHVGTVNNLGSDSNTIITATSDDDLTAETTDTWIASMQNYSGGNSSDVRIGHVLQGPGAVQSPLATIQFVVGDDNPFWWYTVTLAPGETGSILIFASGQPTKAAAAAKAAELASETTIHMFDCLTPTLQSQIRNFVIPDKIPDAFVFTPQTGVPPSSTRTSNTITVAGIEEATAISVTGGEYAINDEAPTSAPGMVVAGNSVTVYALSSSDLSTLVTVSLTIGGVTAAFEVTTGVDIDLIVGEPFFDTQNICEAGGVRLHFGTDYNDDGELNEEETDRTQYICNGRNAQVTSLPLDPDPERCPNGGVELTIGVRELRPLGDPSSSGSLVVEDICNGTNSLVRTAAIDGDEDCPNGGVGVDTWLDDDGDGMLSDDETAISQKVCDGDSVLIETTTLAPDAAVCPRGGLRLHAGTDGNGNGELDDEEVSTDRAICHGVNGLVTTKALEPDAEECPTGGIQIDAGTDANSDRVLDDSEVNSSHTLCNGVLTLSRTIELEPDVDTCAFGGSKVESGLDLDDDRELDDDEVVTSALVCNGMNAAVRTISLSVGSNECPAGGSVVETGTDANGDGELDNDEVEERQPLCQPPQLLFETKQLAQNDAKCPHGGLRVTSGHDDGEPDGIPGDGKLQAKEIELDKSICLAPTEVLVSGGHSDCSVALGRRSSDGLLYAVLFGTLGLFTRRRRGTSSRRRSTPRR